MSLNNPFDASTLLRLGNNAEDDFARERPCILDRASIGLLQAVDVYTLPDYVISIKRVTYLGWQLYPLPHRDLRQSYLSGTQQSRPYWYIFNNIGLNQIKLFPVPSVNLAQVASPWTQPGISQGFIIEFYRTPDQVTFTIPTWFGDRIRDNYANYRAYAMEGQWQNMKASTYYKNKWLKLRDRYATQLDELQGKPRNLVASDSAQRPYGYVPPPPILPVNRYGISVDEPSW